MEKYKRQEVSPVEEENERDERYQAANPNIDSRRTKDNYHIIYPRQSYIETINSRLERLELKRKIRSDAIYMNSFVITSDGEFFKDMRAWEQYAFFEDCARFFMDKYGYENVLSAVVHMDETTPHLHLNIVPINEGRVSSKSLFDRRKLAQLQTELWEQVGKRYGLKRGKYGSAAKHVSAAEHRAKNIVEEAKQRGAEIDEQTEKKKTELADLTQTVYAVTEASNKPIPKKKKDVESEIKALRTKNAMQEREIQIRGRDQHDLYTQLQEAKSAESRKETAYKIVTDMMSAYPDEFDALLKKSRDKKAGGGQSSFRKNSGSWSK